MIQKLFRFSTISAFRNAIIVLTAALFTGACVSMPDDESLSRSNLPIIIDGLDVSFMSAVIVQGFKEIMDRALDEPDIDDVFAAALKELRRVDRNLSIEVTGRQIHLSVGEDSKNGNESNVTLSLGEKHEDDVKKWSIASMNAILWARRNSEIFRQADDEVLYEALFDGALSKLDAFSRYDGRREAALNRLIRDGVMGLGVRVVSAAGGALVQSIMVDGPAAKAGLLIDDLIVAADDVQLARLSLPEIRRRLEGQAEGIVKLTIRRIGEPGDFAIEAHRQLIVADTVTSRIVDDVVELRIRSFNQRTAQAVETAFLRAQASSENKLKGIVLDLRGDPGGLLDQAIAVADRFLESGSISELRGRHPGANQSYSAGRGDIANGLPIAVVVDGRAASAAEIVAAALQGNDRAIVIGTVTLGKGSVQTILRLLNNGELALTWSRAAAPGGIGLHGLGVLPNICLSGKVLPASEVISGLLVTPNPMVSARALWINPPGGSNDKISSLRDECPAETRTGRALDLEVARRIVSDPALLSIAAADSGPQIAVTP
jgi:carboxyl-terminal processing protease